MLSSKWHVVYGPLLVTECDSEHEALAVKAALEELPVRAARALNIAEQAGRAPAVGDYRVPEDREVKALQDMLAVALSGKEVRAAYDALLSAGGIVAFEPKGAEAERFICALALLKTALDAGNGR